MALRSSNPYNFKETSEQYFVYEMKIIVDTSPYRGYATFQELTTWPRLEHHLLSSNSPIEYEVSTQQVPYQRITIQDKDGMRDVKVAVHPDIAEFFKIKIEDRQRLEGELRDATRSAIEGAKQLRELQSKSWQWHIKEAWRKFRSDSK